MRERERLAKFVKSLPDLKRVRESWQPVDTERVDKLFPMKVETKNESIQSYIQTNCDTIKYLINLNNVFVSVLINAILFHILE